MDFASFLRRIKKERLIEDQQFCFVLGAGASYSCGIPKASELADKWYDELLQESLQSEQWQWRKILKDSKEKALDETINALKTDESLFRQVLSPMTWENDGRFTLADLIRIKFTENESEKYSRLFSAVYPTPTMRRNYIKSFVQGAKPGQGHEALGQLLCKTNNNIVITTNFDTLVETAIHESGHGKDLITMKHCNDTTCSAFDAEGSLNPVFQQQRSNAALVIKAHGDLDRAEQKNTIEELRQLHDDFYKKLKSIFHNYKPIFIGYSGNDSGLVDLLVRYANEVQRKSDNCGCYWLIYGDDMSHPEDCLPERARTYLRQVNGQCITHKGFESSICEIADALLSETGGSMKPTQNIKEIPKDEISITERKEKTDFPIEDSGFRYEMMLRNASIHRDTWDCTID